MPAFAPALFASVKGGAPQETSGLDCKEPSFIALKGLARDADMFMTITEVQGDMGSNAVAQADLPSSPSGAAGIAGLMVASANKTDFGLTSSSRVMVVLSEEPAQ
eukprot:scaffold1192_cov169-Amphora_coffeaeformis.AAC.1